jgi:hypothetical protein
MCNQPGNVSGMAVPPDPECEWAAWGHLLYHNKSQLSLKLRMDQFVDGCASRCQVFMQLIGAVTAKKRLSYVHTTLYVALTMSMPRQGQKW